MFHRWPPAPPDPLPPAIEQGVRTMMLARPQGEAEIPLDALRRRSFPKLVTSGGYHPVFEAIWDRLHRELTSDRAIPPLPASRCRSPMTA